jgi:hypothetical protein
MEIRIRKDQYQDLFLSSESKFPALLAAVGTGKTLCLLTKIFKYLEDWPGSTGLLVRREFVDLRDSSMRDFERYFSVKFDSTKNYKFPNGSVLMCRHAAELNMGNLKNINLAIAGIEQAEEFDDDTVFQFIRDRLRQQNGATVRPMCIIANANGHNWIWKQWINNATAREIDAYSGQSEYLNGEYHAITANTWANEQNLPPDFIADLKRKEIEAPSHFRRYVLNSFEEMEQDDYVFKFTDLMKAKVLQFAARQGYGHRIFGYDIARYGNDKCAAVGIHQHGALAWSVCHVEQWGETNLNETCGRILSTSNTNHANDNIIDEDGIGSGPLDFITHGRKRDDFRGFKNSGYSYDDNKDYANQRTEAAFKLKDYVDKGWIAIPQEELIQELMTLRYKYTNDGRRILVSKEEMRKKGVKSPNMADALLMAASLIYEVKHNQDHQYWQRPQHTQEENLFQIAGVR